MSDYTLLIIEDEAVQRKALEAHLREENYGVESASSAGEAVKIVMTKRIDAVISDFKLPDRDGMYILEQVKSVNPEIPVILVTAYGSIDHAVDAIKTGAYHYLTKPVNMDELLVILKRALEHMTLVSENIRLREALQERFTVKGIISASPKMQEVMNIAGRVAKSKASVLVRGESGTGKEVIARTIHYASGRKNAPFIAFNVGALSPTLIESELFGHEKGAFTGADRMREGRFIQAHSGTLFIDEIGDIPVELQAKFLRVLQENYVEKIGSSEPVPIDVRIIAATNKDLELLMKKGKFREDLYYRLNVVSINIPPLRERKEDILPLCDLFIERYASENKKEITGFTREAFDVLMKYDFPGNVRELENIVERAVVLARNSQITLNDLPPHIFIQPDTRQASSESGLDKQVEALEVHLIQKELRKAGGNQSKAARALKISERKLRYKMKKYNLG